MFHNVCGQFRRRFPQDILDQVEDLDDRLADDVVELTLFDGHFPLEAVIEAAAHEVIAPVFQGQDS